MRIGDVKDQLDRASTSIPLNIAEGNGKYTPKDRCRFFDQALRAGLARKLIQRRWGAGLSQAEVARRAGIRPETVNRIEKAKVTADTSTVTKIVRVLEKAERKQAKGKA